MIEAVLFDLDNTLLGNPMDVFMPAYLKLFRSTVPDGFDKDMVVEALLRCTQLMIRNVDTAVSNWDAFWEPFSQRMGINADELGTYLDHFYANLFEELEDGTAVIPEAAPLVQSCFDAGLKVVVATNPVFPQIAIEHRLKWANLPVAEYAFDVVTHSDNMRFTKPHVGYYEQILGMIDQSPERALMVGDSWTNDIEPAHQLGMRTFWIAPNDTELPESNIATACGSMADLHQLVKDGWLE